MLTSIQKQEDGSITAVTLIAEDQGERDQLKGVSDSYHKIEPVETEPEHQEQ